MALASWHRAIAAAVAILINGLLLMYISASLPTFDAFMANQDKVLKVQIIKRSEVLLPPISEMQARVPRAARQNKQAVKNSHQSNHTDTLKLTTINKASDHVIERTEDNPAQLKNDEWGELGSASRTLSKVGSSGVSDPLSLNRSRPMEASVNHTTILFRGSISLSELGRLKACTYMRNLYFGSEEDRVKAQATKEVLFRSMMKDGCHW